jgi:hypothetical protein
MFVTKQHNPITTTPVSAIEFADLNINKILESMRDADNPMQHFNPH